MCFVASYLCLCFPFGCGDYFSGVQALSILVGRPGENLMSVGL